MSRSITLKTFRSKCLHAQTGRSTSPWALRRPYSTIFDVNAIEPVSLRFDKTPAKADDEASNSGDTVKPSPIVLLHGFLASKRNWGSIGKAFAQRTGRPIYTVDLRNHGDSPHTRPHTYEAMTADLFHFFETHQLKNVTLIGHSMGGKAAMSMALHPELPKGTISELAIEDVAPSRGPLSPEFTAYVDAMKSIEENRVRTRKEAQEILSQTESNLDIVNFLLTNLVTPKSGSGDSVKFRIPLEILFDHLDDLGSFPYETGDVRFYGPTLFIKGSRSNYINKKTVPATKRFFPNKNLVTLNASHWVHSERPLEFLDTILGYFSKLRERERDSD